jgi:hypothetical protein
MKQKSYARYHRYDTQGKKYIKRFELGVEPSDKVIEGFGPWIRGTGPFEPQALHNVTEGIRRACSGVPKSPEQKQKMREAKLGVPKTQEHKDNMRLSWIRRREQELSKRYIVDEIQSTSTTSAT